MNESPQSPTFHTANLLVATVKDETLRTNDKNRNQQNNNKRNRPIARYQPTDLL
jgi:hypothetical protein